jgi:methylthioribose-1-phosphate isomerase
LRIGSELEDILADFFTIRWENGVVRMLDQRLLPDEVVYRDFKRSSEVANAIQKMVIRGAPAIGVAAGYGLALTAFHSRATRTDELIDELTQSAAELRNSRPTAVNLFAAVQRIMQVTERSAGMDTQQIKENVIHAAMFMDEEDRQMDLRIAHNGQQFIPDQANLFHHCNTGALATSGIGTALGVIRLAHESGKKIHVYVDETRPRLQGARLTSWELKQLGIPHTVVIDGASGYVMKNYKIDACLVGCDRIAANGDVANKIGTYNLALVAYAHGVPFYCVGPMTTVDLSISSGKEIPVEQRPGDEVSVINGRPIVPDGVTVSNPAFDITPAKYITAMITDRGIAFPPFEQSLMKLSDK